MGESKEKTPLTTYDTTECSVTKPELLFTAGLCPTSVQHLQLFKALPESKFIGFSAQDISDPDWDPSDFRGLLL